MDFDDHELTKSYVTAHKVDVSTRHVKERPRMRSASLTNAVWVQTKLSRITTNVTGSEPARSCHTVTPGTAALLHSLLNAFRSDNSDGGVRSESSLSVPCARG